MPDEPAETEVPLKRTPLYDLHLELGAKMVPFAGYEMPVQYRAGIMAEHKHTRTAAGLFDVSHMGQAWLTGAHVATALETLVPGDIEGLAPGQSRYTVLLTEDGGILDDLIVARPIDAQPLDDGDGDGSRLLIVVNAACKESDFAHIGTRLAGRAALDLLGDDRALLALQGPAAANVMDQFCAAAPKLGFMTTAPMDIAGLPGLVSRSGYTGEDGFEISVAAAHADKLARILLASRHVKPVGLGARDSLRLEAGLCLYGHDIDHTTDPVEAGLNWVIPKRRRATGGFPGAERILKALKEGPARKRVGLKPLGKAPAREGTPILNDQDEVIGIVTSGGFGPSIACPIAMGYVESIHAKPGTRLALSVRGTSHPAEVVPLPFVPTHYAKP